VTGRVLTMLCGLTVAGCADPVAREREDARLTLLGDAVFYWRCAHQPVVQAATVDSCRSPLRQQRTNFVPFALASVCSVIGKLAFEFPHRGFFHTAACSGGGQFLVINGSPPATKPSDPLLAKASTRSNLHRPQTATQRPAGSFLGRFRTPALTIGGQVSTSRHPKPFTPAVGLPKVV
jgi:hypothetical protein